MPLRILALEASGMSGEVALLEEGEVVVEQNLAANQRTAQSLAPGIRAALDIAGWSAREVELIAVTIGPGSFTGLRVGVTTAKTMAYALGCGVIGVDTLAVIAAQAPLTPGKRLWSVLDAQRGQLFAASFTVVNECWQPESVPHIVDADVWWKGLAADDLVTGSGMTRLHEALPNSASVVANDLWQPRAATVGRLGRRDYQAGRRDDFWALSPVYLRASAAEEKAAS